MLGHGQAGQGDARTGARRLVHLAVDQRHLRLGEVLQVDDARLDHLVIEVVAFAGALADPGEHRISAMALGDVVDQLHDQHGLADTGAAEQADLAALHIRRQQIDDLDAGLEHFRLGRLLDELRRRTVDRAALVGLDRSLLVHRLADDVDDAPQRGRAHRHRDRLAGVGHDGAAHQALGGVHGDGAHGVLAEMLGHFQHQPVALVVRLQRVQDRGQLVAELHIDDGPDHLGDFADSLAHLCLLNLGALPRPR